LSSQKKVTVGVCVWGAIKGGRSVCPGTSMCVCARFFCLFFFPCSPEWQDEHPVCTMLKTQTKIIAIVHKKDLHAFYSFPFPIVLACLVRMIGREKNTLLCSGQLSAGFSFTLSMYKQKKGNNNRGKKETTTHSFTAFFRFDCFVCFW